MWQHRRRNLQGSAGPYWRLPVPAPPAFPQLCSASRLHCCRSHTGPVVSAQSFLQLDSSCPALTLLPAAMGCHHFPCVCGMQSRGKSPSAPWRQARCEREAAAGGGGSLSSVGAVRGVLGGAPPKLPSLWGCAGAGAPSLGQPRCPLCWAGAASWHSMAQ